MTRPLLELQIPTLRSLLAALRSGRIAQPNLAISLSRSLGNSGKALEEPLRKLFDEGMTAAHIAILVETVLAAREQSGTVDRNLELVLSGPDVPGIPTGDTAATMRRLIDESSHEVLLVGYALNNVRDLFERLATRMESDPTFKVVLCFDIGRPKNDTSLDSEIVRRFAHEFRKRHWPWKALPELFYDPRALDLDPKKRASLHAKCIVVDSSKALITSANFTEAAQRRNVEVGVLVMDPAVARRVANYFEALWMSGQFGRCALG